MRTDFEFALSRNLAYLQWLAERLVEAGSLTRQSQFLKEYGRALERHFGVIEEIVVPALEANGARDGVSTADLAHDRLRPELAELLDGNLEPAAFSEKLAPFLARAAEHLQGEALALVPLVREHLDAEDALSLGFTLQEQLRSEAPPVGGPLS
jgi:hypothetical protein